jgi:hypothetical protein
VARVRIVVAALAAASVLSLAGAAWSVSSSAARIPDDGSSQYYNGYYEAGDPLNLNYATIAEGRYALGYSMTVVADSPAPDALLVCSFVDPNGRIDYLANNYMVFPADGTPQQIDLNQPFDLPSLTIALRCSPTLSGELSVQFSNIAVTIDRVAD